MGEYYNWINIDRKEYICPSDFDFGNKRFESIMRNNVFLDVLRDLLANEWNGCRIAWLGDECIISKETNNELLQELILQSETVARMESVIDTVFDSYKNVSGLYKEAEEEVRTEINFYIEDVKAGRKDAWNTYGINLDAPFENLFCRTGKSYKYIVNYTKKISYAFDQTQIMTKDGMLIDTIDPLPILLGYGRALEEGVWLGDVIGAADVIDESIKMLDSIIIEWD